MEDHPDPRISPIVHLVLGGPLSIVGFIGAILWYRQVSNNAASVPGTSNFGLVGPLILGFFSLVMLVWVILGIISLVTHIKK